MSKIIFLNGCGSSGKTSIARSIGYLSAEEWLTIGVDAFIGMLPYQKEGQYFTFNSTENEYGAALDVKKTEKGEKFFKLLPEFARLLADNGYNLIIDEVLLEDEELLQYVRALDQHEVSYVGIFCELNTLRQREVLRGDRDIGLSNAQVNRVHEGLRAGYDFKVDTTLISPFEVARNILNFLEGTPYPLAFRNLKKSSC